MRARLQSAAGCSRRRGVLDELLTDEVALLAGGLGETGDLVGNPSLLLERDLDRLHVVGKVVAWVSDRRDRHLEVAVQQGWWAPNSLPICSFGRRWKSLMGRIVLIWSILARPMPTSVVTGGAGFLGSHLCEELLRRGHRVICVDNLETGSLANIEHIRDEQFIHLLVDIIEPYFIDEPIDFVYHLASPASPIDYLRLPLHTLKVGSHGTHHTLGLAKHKRARFLIASTSEVYGDPQVHPQPESYWGHVNPIGPRGVYDEAKRYAEALTMAYHRQQGVDTAIMRIFNTYGIRMRPHDGRAIPTFMRQALQNRPITVFGTGSQTRSFCYVDDLIRGMILLAESGEHDPVNIGNPIEFTLLELAKTVIEVTGSNSEIVYEALPTDDPQVRQPDITRAREILGWEPEIDLRTGLQRTLEASGRDALIGRGG
jgi:dTDP-glucose 4,6-dehydratase